VSAQPGASVKFAFGLGGAGSVGQATRRPTGVQPDLVPSWVSVATTNPTVGRVMSLHYKLKNGGGVAAKPSVTRFYLSRDRRRSR